VNRRIPLLLQFFETPARIVAETILDTKPELRLVKPCIFFVKLGLVKLLESL
jgi:hypothetical protein